MKKVNLLAIVICTVYQALAQSTVSQPSYLYMESNSSNNLNVPTVDRRFFLQLKNNAVDFSSFVGMVLTAGGNTIQTSFVHHAREYLYSDYAGFGQIHSRDHGLILRVGSPENPNGVIKFMTSNTLGNLSLERMRLSADGNLGIGSTNPKSKLQITDGDVYLDNPSRGIVLKSPNGNCWRVTIDDSGNFVRTNIACP